MTPARPNSARGGCDPLVPVRARCHKQMRPRSTGDGWNCCGRSVWLLDPEEDRIAAALFGVEIDP